jgi:hypothetical protein
MAILRALIIVELPFKKKNPFYGKVLKSVIKIIISLI